MKDFASLHDKMYRSDVRYYSLTNNNSIKRKLSYLWNKIKGSLNANNTTIN